MASSSSSFQNMSERSADSGALLNNLMISGTVCSEHPMVTRLKTGSLPPPRIFSTRLVDSELLELKNIVEALNKTHWF